MRKMIVAMLIVIGVPWPVQAATASNLTVDILQCDAGLAEKAQLFSARAEMYPNLEYERLHPDAQDVGGGIFRLSATVKQGNYFIKAQSQHCEGQLQVVVISGKHRRVSLAMAERCPLCNIKQFSTENGIAGVLPMQPAAGFLVSPTGSRRILDIQEGAYYLERIPPLRYVMRFELHGGLQVEIPLNLSNLSATGWLREDISPALFRQNLRSITVQP